MSRRKKMTITFIVVALVLIGLATAAWWHIFFGTVNPPLPRADVAVQSSTAPGNAYASTTPAAAASGTASASPIAPPVNDQENPPLPEERLTVDEAIFNVEIASTVLEQTRGLSFRPSLGANDGMLFVFATGSVQSFWMKDMQFPLDMIWISGNTITGFAQDAPAPAPGTALWNLPVFSSPANVDKVLEVNAGTVAKYNIKIGDTVAIGPVK